jgi:endonuclease/exonuclease/phosphatase family metal-dependent hydrolase
MQTLNVATLNIWNRSGPWPERLALIRRELEALGAPIVGLQEVMRLVTAGTVEPLSDEHDQAFELARGLGYAIAYGVAADYGNGLLMGNALLSRFPIAESTTFRLPDQGTREGRSLLYAVLETPHGRQPVFVTHLNWRPEQGFVRLKQVVFIVEHIEKLCPPNATGTLPPILMGDFNAEPDSDEMRYLRGLHVVDGKSTYFADSWVYGARDAKSSATFDPRNDFARTHREPPRRIDYIYVRGPDAELRGEPLRARLIFDQPSAGANGPIWPSDHFGVYAELAVEPRGS